MAYTDCYTVDQVADICHVSARTLATWRRTGTGPPSAKFGTVVLYRCSQFHNWFDAQFNPATDSDLHVEMAAQ